MIESHYLIEHRLSGGQWRPLSAPIYGLDDAHLSIEHTRGRNPNTTFRLVKRTTTTEVVDA